MQHQNNIECTKQNRCGFILSDLVSIRRWCVISVVLFSLILSGCASRAVSPSSIIPDRTESVSQPSGHIHSASRVDPHDSDVGVKWSLAENGVSTETELFDSIFGKIVFGNSVRTVGHEELQPIPEQPISDESSPLLISESFLHGEYIGPARLAHVPEYRLRVDDILEFVFRITGEATTEAYEINVGDTIRVESLTEPALNRELVVQPDGMVTLPHVGQVRASDRTLDELRSDLEEQLKTVVKTPAITVTPIALNTKLLELRSTVDSRAGAGGQSRQAKVTPEGTVQLPAIGSVSAQGLTLDELRREIEEKYAKIVRGIEITPILLERAPRFVFVVGEVGNPGRIPLEGPTSVIQSIAMAGSWNIGAHLNHIVVLRRDENWNLMALKLELHDALFGRYFRDSDEIWLRDSDVVIVPKRPIQWTGDLIELIFTRGIYSVVPVFYSINFNKLSTI